VDCTSRPRFLKGGKHEPDRVHLLQIRVLTWRCLPGCYKLTIPLLRVLHVFLRIDWPCRTSDGSSHLFIAAPEYLVRAFSRIEHSAYKWCVSGKTYM
jgi:hypothetical protein